MKEKTDSLHIDELSPSEKKEKFLIIRQEFFQVILFLIALGAGFAYFIQDYKNQKWQVVCDAENTSMHLGKMHFRHDDFFFSGAELQSTDFSRSHEHSIKLSPNYPYGFQIDFPDIRGNEEVEIQLWRYSSSSEGNGAGIVAEVRGVFYQMQQEVKKKEETGWELLEMKFTLDCRTERKSLRIYCWNPTQETVYFDDLRINLYREGVF